MADANAFIETMKRAALEAHEASRPVNVCFGEVISVSPLKIKVEQKLLLGEKQLVLTRNVTDYVTTVSESNTDSADKKLSEKQIIVRNGLRAGDLVIIVRQQEGQKFIVIDRIGGGL